MGLNTKEVWTVNLASQKFLLWTSEAWTFVSTFPNPETNRVTDEFLSMSSCNPKSSIYCDIIKHQLNKSIRSDFETAVLKGGNSPLPDDKFSQFDMCKCWSVRAAKVARRRQDFEE